MNDGTIIIVCVRRIGRARLMKEHNPTHSRVEFVSSLIISLGTILQSSLYGTVRVGMIHSPSREKLHKNTQRSYSTIDGEVLREDSNAQSSLQQFIF